MDVSTVLATIGACSVIDLEQPRTSDAPFHPGHKPGYHYFLHRRHEPGMGEARTSASGMIVTAEHAGTHIDALCHQAEEMRLYGDIDVTSRVQTSAGFTAAGIETVPPLIGRGVLLDVAAAHGGLLPERRFIEPADLDACEERQGVRVGQGDVALVRTGYGSLWHDPDRYALAAGGSSAASRWLIERGVRAVGCDNLAWDVTGYTDADTGTTLPGHVLLLVRSGIYIVENLLLEGLAARGAYEFLFFCVPLKFIGATGSPVRPLALLPA